jgi:hypothetical protein
VLKIINFAPTISALERFKAAQTRLKAKFFITHESVQKGTTI